MEILIGSFLLCALYAIIIYSLPIKIQRKNILFLCISFIQITLIHGLVDVDCVPDLCTYESVFKRCAKMTFFDSITYEDGTNESFERGFRAYLKIYSYFINNFQLLLVINSGIMFYIYYVFFNRYSPYVWFSVLLMLLVSYNQSLFVIRQHLSFTVLFCGYPYIIQKDLKRFTFVVFIAYLLHNSSLIFWPVYFLYNIKDKKRYFFVMSCLSLILSVVIMTVISKYGTIFTRNDYYIENAKTGVATKALIMAVVMACYIFFLKRRALEEGIYKLVFTISFLGIVGNALVGESGGGRIFWSYYIIVVLQIPICMYFIKSKFVKTVFCISVIIIYMAWAYALATDVIFWLDFKLAI